MNLMMTLAELDQLRHQVSLVDVIQSVLSLSRRADQPLQWTGSCPFHDDQAASLRVHTGKNIWHCFGCGVGGDIFGWLMRRHGLSFPEAVARASEMVVNQSQNAEQTEETHEML